MPSVSPQPTGPSPDRPPLLTLVVPAFNVAEWIEEFLFSLQRQTMTDFEAIIVDDGSADGTREIIERHAETDRRLRLFDNPGKGGGSARNFGLSQAEGAYLVFADGDDVVPEHAFEIMTRTLDATGSDMAVLDHLVFSTVATAQRSQSIPVYDSLRTGITLNDEPMLLRDRVCWKKVFRRDWWVENGIEFSDSARSNDIFAMSVAYAAADRIDIVPEIGYAYRRRPGTSSMSSQAHELGSLRDHFREELKCYQYLNGVLSPAAREIYFTNLLSWDIYAHLRGLAGQAINSENEATWLEAAEAARYLHDQAPPQVLHELQSNRKDLYALLTSDNRHDLLQLWPGTHTTTAEQVLAELRDPATLRVLRQHCADGDQESVNRVKVMVREHFLRTLIDNWHRHDPSVLRAALEKLGSYVEELVPADQIEDREQLLFEFLRTSSDDIPEWLHEVVAAGKIKISAFRVKGRSVRLEVKLGTPTAPQPDLVLWDRTGRRLVLPAPTGPDSDGAHLISTKTLGAFGVWNIAVEWRFDGHTVTETVYAKHADPVARVDVLKAVLVGGETPLAIRFDTPRRIARLAAGGVARHTKRIARGTRRRAAVMLHRVRRVEDD
ncbi:glycosyltransferase [Leucobacter sp. wl10]|uniref:glycosyltransferase n=1 Tax=Leucobacter sp. wl10 TaxID=2304677 RepID=UPI0013C34CBB|nr:glycosyltransferase [Leucobacter sp. wl10]